MYMARPQSKKIKKILLNQTMKAKLKRIIGKDNPDESRSIYLQQLHQKAGAASEKEDAASEKEDAAVEKEDAAVEKEDAAVEKDDAAVEKEDAAVEKEDPAVEKEDAAAEQYESKSSSQKHMSDEEIDKSFGGEENTDALSFWLKKAQDLLLNPKITQEMIYDSIEPMRLGSMSNTPFLREQLREIYQLIRILRILEYNIQNPQYN